MTAFFFEFMPGFGGFLLVVVAVAVLVLAGSGMPVTGGGLLAVGEAERVSAGAWGVAGFRDLNCWESCWSCPKETDWSRNSTAAASGQFAKAPDSPYWRTLVFMMGCLNWSVLGLDSVF